MEKSGKSSKSDAPKEKGKKCPGCGHWVALLTEKSCPTTNGAPVVAPAEGINLIRGTGSGRQLQDRDCSGSDDEGAAQNSIKPSATKGNLGGMFGMLRGLEGSKSLSREDMESVLDKMHDHLIAKNVAADTAVQLCESVANKLEGKVMGTFSMVTSKASSPRVPGANSATTAPCGHAPGYHGCPAPSAPLRGHFLWCE